MEDTDVRDTAGAHPVRRGRHERSLYRPADDAWYLRYRASAQERAAPDRRHRAVARSLLDRLRSGAGTERTAQSTRHATGWLNEARPSSGVRRDAVSRFGLCEIGR